MTTETKPKRNDDAGSTLWSKMLAKCIDSVGTDSFYMDLQAALKVLAGFDYSVSYAYYKNETPICLDHAFSTEKRVILVDEYLKGPYLLDPFFKACSRKIETGLYRIRDIAPDRFYQSEYYRSYYNLTGLAEEICFTFYLKKGVAIVVSLMRKDESSKFSAREFRLLDRVAPIVISLARHHWKDVPQQFNIDTANDESHDDTAMIENRVSDLFAERLTPRETQVVAQVLEGHSSDSIAKDLGISVGTVRIHRRNIYAKLQISSQQELFSIFFKNITSKGGFT